MNFTREPGKQSVPRTSGTLRNYSGIRRTEEDDGCIYVLPMQVPLDLSGGLTCDWRDGDLW